MKKAPKKKTRKKVVRSRKGKILTRPCEIVASTKNAGNKAWMLRASHGVDKIFSDPQAMWEAAVEYFEWAEANPLYETKVVDKQLMEVPVIRAMTMPQLCFHLGVSDSYFRTFKSTQKDNESSSGFLAVINSIERVVREQKFQGAAANLLNANIISRDLGLIDKRDLTTDGEKITAPPLQCFTSAPPLAGDEKEVQENKNQTK